MSLRSQYFLATPPRVLYQRVPISLRSLTLTTAEFPAGESVDILLGFANAGEEQFNITHITASFNYPLDYSYYIQNVSCTLAFLISLHSIPLAHCVI